VPHTRATIRIPEEELEQLKQSADLVSLIRSKGVVLSQRGKDFVGHCPFHDDKTPSLVVTPSKNLWHCFGACNKGGSVIDWVMQADKVSFRHAVELLREGGIGSLTGTKILKSTNTIPKLPSPLVVGAANSESLKQTIHYYHECFKRSSCGCI